MKNFGGKLLTADQLGHRYKELNYTLTLKFGRAAALRRCSQKQRGSKQLRFLISYKIVEILVYCLYMRARNSVMQIW